jgi:hydroxyacylglutathione hydrolase
MDINAKQWRLVMLEVVRIPVLQDNYIWLAKAGNDVAVIDPAEAAPVLDMAAMRGWSITHILNTHWHPDHVGGNLDIQKATGCFIIGPRGEEEAIPGIDRAVSGGDTVSFGGMVAEVIDVPGHTRGHIAFHFAAAAALFCGDTLFALGCGRLFEGTAVQMWESLSKLMALPPATTCYCAHEYTQSNGRFALHVEPDNKALVTRMVHIDAMRLAGEATVPFTLAQELATNPFLRAGSAEGFAQRRAAKDTYSG